MAATGEALAAAAAGEVFAIALAIETAAKAIAPRKAAISGKGEAKSERRKATRSYLNPFLTLERLNSTCHFTGCRSREMSYSK